LALLAFLEVMFHGLPPGNFLIQAQIGMSQGLKSALRLLSQPAVGNISECDPAPFPSSNGADCGRAPKGG
jgi:hypothetical protein